MGHFLVVGAGIAGLAAALALGRDGHAVDVVDRRAALDEVGAGLQLSPNATRIARELGVLDRLEAVSVEPRALTIRRGRDGATVATLPFGDAARARFGAPFLLIHRADLQSVLACAAASCPGVRLSLATVVTQTDPSTGVAALSGPAGARTATADGIVRADGLHAKSPDGRAPVHSGKTAWRALVPAGDLPAEFTRHESNLWLGHRAHLMHYPIRRGALVNVVVIVDEHDDRGRTPADFWAEPGDPSVLRTRLADWQALPRRLIEAAPGWRKWPLFDRKPDLSWSCGRQTVAGDAAHPMLPFLAQGASQAIEDAAALAKAVAAHRGDITAAFRLYGDDRRERTRRVQEASRRQGRIYHLAGPAAVARDLAMGVLGPQRLVASMDWLYGPVTSSKPT